MKSRLLTAAMVVALLGVGFLLGSFWLEWRHTRLGQDAPPPEVRGTPVAVPDGWEGRIRVEVLNGMGEPGAAERAARRLRKMGFDVVYYGNAESFDHARTRVLRRSARPDAVRRLADSLGVAEVVARPDPGLYVDGTVILGPRWRERMAARDSVLRARKGPPLWRELLKRIGF